VESEKRFGEVGGDGAWAPGEGGWEEVREKWAREKQMLEEEVRLARQEAKHRLELCALTGRELERTEAEVEFLKTKVSRMEEEGRGRAGGGEHGSDDEEEEEGVREELEEEVQWYRERVTWLEAELLRRGGVEEEEIDMTAVMQFLEDTQVPGGSRGF
jgi:hypothetical protein